MSYKIQNKEDTKFKLTKILAVTIMLILIISLAYSKKCDGNSYETNQCLKNKIAKFETRLKKVQNHNITDFKKLRDKTCSYISSTYEGGSYQVIKYGNCVISLDR